MKWAGADLERSKLTGGGGGGFRTKEQAVNFVILRSEYGRI